ncbi:DUF1642 domain-containing protein [Latilactobacillus curvatus]
MNEKVKLPRNVIDVFRPVLDSPDVAAWLNDYDNQWKLIDALRYGYEAEAESLYYVRFIQNNSHSFLNSSESDGLEFSDNEETEYIKTKFTMPEILAIDPRYKAFAVPVEEVDADD